MVVPGRIYFGTNLFRAILSQLLHRLNICQQKIDPFERRIFSEQQEKVQGNWHTAIYRYRLRIRKPLRFQL